jgi:hypothetical protein
MHPNSRDQILLDIEERIAVTFPSFDSTATCVINSHARIFPDLEEFLRQWHPQASVIPKHKKLMFELLPATGTFSVTFDLGVPEGIDTLTGKPAIDSISSPAESIFNGRSRSHLQEIRNTLADETRYALVEFGIRNCDFDHLDDANRYALFGHPRRFPYPFNVTIARMLVSNSPVLWYATRAQGPIHAK